MEDLSHLVPGLLGGESMAAVNTTSDQTAAMSAPGSESESTRDNITGTPGPVVPPERPRTVVHPSAAPRIPNPWRRADGSPWENSAPDEPGGNAPSGRWPQS